MSQTTANDLLIGMTAVSTEPSKSTASPKRSRLMLWASTLVLLVGFKVIGDAACNYAIDAWTERQRAPLTVVDPAMAAMLQKMYAEAEAEAVTDATATDAAIIQ